MRDSAHSPHSPYPPGIAFAQQRASADVLAKRVTDRIAALQREAQQLATESRTLVGDLRALEIERDLQREQARAAEGTAAEADRALQATSERLAALEQQRVAQLPDLKLRLVDLYKHGRSGYAGLLFRADSVRDLARATRTVASLAHLNQISVEDHRRTLAALTAERATAAARAHDMQAALAQAQVARTAAERAVASRAALIAGIARRRDLTAQLTGELEVARDHLQQMTTAAAGRTAEPLVISFAPFRGALEWPATGVITGRFGQAAGRLGGSAVRNGIEIKAAEGAPARAVHGGEVVYADAFSGFGTLVILDHGGNNYSLYGYLASASASRGDRVDGGAEVGRVGSAPAGPPALYFEIRVDGRSVDPLQWLKPGN